jgi:CheY-like chemotaxis protein
VGLPSAALLAWVGTLASAPRWPVLAGLWLLWTAAAALLAWRMLRAGPPRPVSPQPTLPQTPDWLAGAAHTLRNRLGAVAGASEVLALDAAGPAVRARARAIVAQHLQAATQLVTDLADLTPAALPAITAQRLDLAAVAAPLLDAQRAAAVQAGQLLLQVLQPAPVLGDAALLARAVRGLLHHAMRRLRHGGTVVLRVHAQPPHAVLMLNAVGDEDGMDPGDAAAPAPFVPDLDCALAQRIVALHGGTLAVDAAGAIRIQLALAAPLEPAAAERPAAPRRIVLVERPGAAGKTAADMLRRAGHRVSVHADAAAGLRSMLSEWPDAAVVDLHLPGAGGLALARQARRAGYAGRLVAVSGYGALDDRAEALRSGFDAHLTRPLRPALLREAIAEAHPGAHGWLQEKPCDA